MKRTGGSSDTPGVGNVKDSHFYLNINCSSFNTNADGDRVCRFSETRSTPIVQKASDYYVSVVRFSIPTEQLPIQQVPVVTGQADPDKLKYSVTLASAAASVTTNLTWIPQHANAPVPPAPTASQNTSTTYYNLYSYQHMVMILNTALSDCATALKLADPGVAALVTPWMKMNTDQTFSLYVDKNLMNSSAPTVTLSLNSELFTLFPTFHYSRSGTSYTISCLANPNNDNIDGNYLIARQSVPNLNGWNGLQSLVISSSSLGMRPEFLSPARSDGATADRTFSILSDFALQNEIGWEWITGAEYVPSAEYRLIELEGDSPLTMFDFQVYWLDRSGQIKELVLGPSAVVNMKLLFRKKALGV